MSPSEIAAGVLYWPACFIGLIEMSSFVVIFVPHGWKVADVETLCRRLGDPENEMIKAPNAQSLLSTEDAEQLPLWRWFCS